MQYDCNEQLTACSQKLKTKEIIIATYFLDQPGNSHEKKRPCNHHWMEKPLCEKQARPKPDQEDCHL